MLVDNALQLLHGALSLPDGSYCHLNDVDMVSGFQAQSSETDPDLFTQQYTDQLLWQA